MGEEYLPFVLCSNDRNNFQMTARNIEKSARGLYKNIIKVKSKQYLYKRVNLYEHI